MEKLKSVYVTVKNIAWNKNFAWGLVVGFALGCLHHYFGL